MHEIYTRLHGVELLKPLIMEKGKSFEITELFEVLPTKYLSILSMEFKREKKELFLQMSKDMDRILLERINFGDIIKEVEAMPTEFIQHVTRMIHQMISYEKMKM